MYRMVGDPEVSSDGRMQKGNRRSFRCAMRRVRMTARKGSAEWLLQVVVRVEGNTEFQSERMSVTFALRVIQQGSINPAGGVILTLSLAKRKDLRLLFRPRHASFGARGSIMHEGGYYTYIMASRSHTLYVGVTGNLQERVFQHKWREHDGFTARYNCDRLVWFEAYQEVQRAIAREKELKGWRREKKIALIEAGNPTWEDLSRKWYDLEPADYSRALDRMNS
jgi:putative endonuclease